MEKIKTLQELREFIIYLEDKYNLLDFEIDGVKPWQLKRVELDYEFSEILGFLNTPHTLLSKKDKFLNVWNFVKSSILGNPFFSKKTDILVVPHSRVMNINGNSIDIYTHYFEEKLIEQKIDFLELERPFLGKHLKSKKTWRKNLDFILIIRDVFFRFAKIEKNDYKLLKNLENEIVGKIGYFDIKSFLIKATKKYKIEYLLYRKLFEKLQPKKIYLVVSYGVNGALIKVAKDLKIETIELQHGAFSEYHFGYSFQNRVIELDYFPDKLYVWSEYWKNLINFPIKKENVVVYGFDYLINKKNFYEKTIRKQNQIVVLSQGMFGEQISKKILDNWDFFKQFEIKYKLHPGEYERWQEYPSLKILSKKENLEILQNTDLYELFASSTYQVGVTSTALYEGVEFGCKTIFLDLPGIEEMDTFKKIYGYEKCL